MIEKEIKPPEGEVLEQKPFTAKSLVTLGEVTLTQAFQPLPPEPIPVAFHFHERSATGVETTTTIEIMARLTRRQLNHLHEGEMPIAEIIITPINPEQP